MQLNFVDPEQSPTASGGYAQAVSVTDARRLVFVSGQIPSDPDSRVPETFDEQCGLVWRNVVGTLEAAGMTVDNLVKVTTFLADRAHRDANSRIRQEMLGEHRPALTVIITDIYDPGWLLEIEAVAAD